MAERAGWPAALVLAALAATPALAVVGASAPGPAEPLPDLVVTALSVAAGAWSPTMTAPPPRAVQLTVQNAGDAPAPDAVVELAVIRADGRRDVLAAFETFPLAPGARATFRGAWTPPADRVGDHDLVATVDPADRIRERDDVANARHARATHAPVPGVYPARALVSEPAPSPVTLGDEWARYALDVHDVANPAPRLVLDRAGNGRDAALLADVPVGAPGVLAHAGFFDGAVALAAPLPGTTPLTVALWLRPNATGRGVLWATDAPACGQALLEYAAGRVRFTASGSACGSVTLDGAAPPGAWTHVAVAVAGDVVTLSVDGRVAAVTPTNGTLAGKAPRLLLGAARVSGGAMEGALDGVALDDVRVYARALTPVEVALLARP